MKKSNINLEEAPEWLDPDLSEEEKAIAISVHKSNLENQKRIDNYPFYRGASYIFINPTRLWSLVFFWLIINIFIAAMCIVMAKTIPLILLVSAIFLLNNFFCPRTFIKEFKEWKIYKKHRKDIADEYRYFTDKDENGNITYHVEFSVKTALTGEIKKSFRISKEDYEHITGLTALPLEFVSSRDVFDYKLDFKKIRSKKKL